MNRECEGLFVNFMGLYDIIGCHMLYFVVNYIQYRVFWFKPVNTLPFDYSTFSYDN